MTLIIVTTIAVIYFVGIGVISLRERAYLSRLYKEDMNNRIEDE